TPPPLSRYAAEDVVLSSPEPEEPPISSSPARGSRLVVGLARGSNFGLARSADGRWPWRRTRTAWRSLRGPVTPRRRPHTCPSTRTCVRAPCLPEGRLSSPV